MKVAVVSAHHPFTGGGAEILAEALTSNLALHGHESTNVRVPFAPVGFIDLARDIELARSLDLSDFDRIIALKFPAYFVPHDHQIVWLLHQYRQAYELAGTDIDPIDRTPLGRSVRNFIKRQDNVALPKVTKLFTSSQVTHDRLLRNNKIESEILHHPIHDADLFVGGTAEPYIFAGGRVNSVKRQHLLLEALALTGPHVKLVLAGPADGGPDRTRIEKLAASLNLHGKLTLKLGFWPRAQVADWVNHSTACAYVPFDEDSFGYFTMEAAHASKPVITTKDSGGLLGLVRDRETGWVVDPTPEALAAAMDDALKAPKRAKAMGESMLSVLDSYDATWPNTIARLMA